MIFCPGLFVFARIDINGNQSFGFVDNEIASAPKIDLTTEGGLELAANIVAIEEWFGLIIEVDLSSWTRADPFNAFSDFLKLLGIINNDFVDILG